MPCPPVRPVFASLALFTAWQVASFYRPYSLTQVQETQSTFVTQLNSVERETTLISLPSKHRQYVLTIKKFRSLTPREFSSSFLRF